MLEIHSDWYQVNGTSGDWLNLSDAAKLFSEKIGGLRDDIDVLKAGFIQYIGVPRRLNVYVAVKNPVVLSQSPYVDKEIADRMVFAGDVFRLAPECVERLLLVGSVSSDDLHMPAVITMASTAPVPGWTNDADYWIADFDCIVKPEIMIDFSDIRIDAEDIRSFSEMINLTRIASDVEHDALGDSSSPTAKSSASDWKEVAREIGESIFKKNKSMTVMSIAKKVNAEMVNRHKNGDLGMTGRGGKIPSADSIKRHALTGIKTKGIGAD